MRISIPDKYLDDESKKNTPKRISRFYKEWLRDGKFDFTVFPDNGYDQMIILKDLDLDSLCTHHILPFHGKAHIGYVPDKHICGISKIARLMDKHAHRTQLQERLTKEIADELEEKLKPLGVMVVIEAQHDCMKIRGVHQRNSWMITSAVRGVFEQKETREEFLQHVSRRP